MGQPNLHHIWRFLKLQLNGTFLVSERVNMLIFLHKKRWRCKVETRGVAREHFTTTAINFHSGLFTVNPSRGVLMKWMFPSATQTLFLLTTILQSTPPCKVMCLTLLFTKENWNGQKKIRYILGGLFLSSRRRFQPCVICLLCFRLWESFSKANLLDRRN